MSTWHSVLGMGAGFFSILCVVPYIITILKGKTRPSRATWWIWFVLSSTISLSYYSTGATTTIWLPVCGGLGQLVVALLSLKYGEGGWSRFDRVCLMGVGISLLLWWGFNAPFVALLCNLIIDLLGAMPTILKSYREPHKESLLTWSLYLTGSILNLFAVEHWSITLAMFPLYIFIVNAAIVGCLLRPKLIRHNKSNRQRRGRRSQRTTIYQRIMHLIGG
jgi:hypothetical protein